MKLPARYNWVPYAGAIVYGITTPVGIAAGLGVRTLYNPDSATASTVSGILDSLSAGILIYTGLVEVRLISLGLCLRIKRLISYLPPLLNE
jgi:zinc transporter 1/2/3